MISPFYGREKNSATISLNHYTIRKFANANNLRMSTRKRLEWVPI